MRDITAEEIEMVNGGDLNEFYQQAQRMFNSWFGQGTSPTAQHQLTGEQMLQMQRECIAAGGTWKATSTTGQFSINFMGMRIGSVGGNGSGSTATYTCQIYA